MQRSIVLLLIAAIVCPVFIAWLLHVEQRKASAAFDWTAAFTDVRGRIQSPCPTTAKGIVAIGQSNAANFIPSLTVRRNLSAYSFYDGRCYAAEDPLLGATGDLGAVWTPLIQKLAEDGTPVAIIAGAVGGSSVFDWQSGGLWNRVADQIAQAEQVGLAVSIVMWHQGETDAIASTLRESYRAALAELINLSRAKSPRPDRPAWIVFQTSICGAKSPGNPEIRAAQADVVDEAKGIYLGMNTDLLDGGFRYDDCHFNAAGRSAIVDATVTLIKEKRLLE